MSIDGQVFTDNQIKYAIVGPPAALEASPNELTVRASAVTSFADVARAENRTLAVYTVDEHGQRLLEYDTAQRSLTAALSPEEDRADVSLTTIRMAKGEGSLEGIVMVAPKKRKYELKLTARPFPPVVSAVYVNEVWRVAVSSPPPRAALGRKGRVAHPSTRAPEQGCP